MSEFEMNLFEEYGIEVPEVKEEKKTAKDVAKEKKSEKKSSSKKTENSSASRATPISGTINVGDVTSKTKLFTNMDGSEKTLAQLLPDCFDANGDLLPKNTKKIKEEPKVETMDLLAADETDAEDKDDKEDKKVESAVVSILTKDRIRAELAKEFPQFESKTMTQFHLDKNQDAIYALISPSTKGTEALKNFTKHRPFVMEQLLPRPIEKDFFVRFLKRAVEVVITEKAEVQWDLYYDSKRDEYLVDEPKQVRALDYVTPEMNIEMQMNYRLIGSVHSHHIFANTPSNTDNASERSFHIYGILGNFPNDRGTINFNELRSLDSDFVNSKNLKFRTYIGGLFYSLEFEEVIAC